MLFGLFAGLLLYLVGLSFTQGNFGDKYTVQELLEYFFDANDFTLECHRDQRLYMVKFFKPIGENCELKLHF